MLGRGNCFDDVQQLSFMSEQVACQTFHEFNELFARELYSEYVSLPKGAEMDKVRDEYHQLGFTGAVSSTDVTHVAWDCCPASQAVMYNGKEGRPTIGYQATVTHSRYAIGVTKGFPGAQNDKSIIRNDKTVSTIRNSKWFREMEYSLKTENGDDELCRGAYLIVDGGYHKVSATDHVNSTSSHVMPTATATSP